MSTYRIPSSLKWLIKNHQTILGRLNQTQKELKEVERYLDHAKEIIEQNAQLNMLIEVLQQDLQAIEHAISLHEIPIELSKLKAKNPHKNPFLLKRGEMTQCIYSILSKRASWVSTTEIVAHVTEHIQQTQNVMPPSNRVRERVNTRLYNMYHLGKIDRIPSGVLASEGFWRQKSDMSDNLYT